jgi:hypothetical protein
MIRGKAIWDEPGPAGRLRGKCDLCGHVHEWPDLRWRCPCGWKRCAGDILSLPSEIADVCPECGRRWVGGEMHGDDDGEAD